ncbi:MAG: RNA polymerase subunit sigma [Deltaproteobacteria bacterium SG8_13]|nr:MAG: RNA polymerase subunit sigma [Deltaproteobacteria bacterium SG8_13]
MDDLIERAARDLAGAKNVAALTGAGISVESNIPPFRGKGGLWEKVDPMEYAHIEAFRRDPGKVWEVLIKGMKDVIDQARPNAAHLGLARLEKLKRLQTIITQNVDGLHQMAGSSDVIEFHGSFAWQCCTRCERRVPTRKLDLDRIPPLCRCGGVLRPECVFFGEMIAPEHLARSQRIASQCEIMLVIGTSATVSPASYIPLISKESGAKVIEINPEPTALTGSVSDYLIAGKAGETTSQIVAQLERLI